MLTATLDGKKLLLPFDEELRAVGVIPGGVPGAAVGVIPDVAVGVGDDWLVGVGTGVVPIVGFGTGVEPTAVGNEPGPLVEVAVAVNPGYDDEGVGVVFLPKGAAARMTGKSTERPVTTSRAMT